MHLDDGRVPFYGLDLEAHDLLPLQPLQDAIQHAVPGPAIPASVDGVPVAKIAAAVRATGTPARLRTTTVAHLPVGKADMASLARKAVLDPKILGLGDFQEPKHTAKL
ncbi:MAG: hypothetical protein A3F68_04580 [Acidobacteria bacterium RIFCSPLOWO2_12_FULL_54_10]|nr:MAG: hypothetical protein A3F68_04580 [Acidobacteria bacterium RIFCSPLOWO2_12_FULL_54_10]